MGNVQHWLCLHSDCVWGESGLFEVENANVEVSPICISWAVKRCREASVGL